MDRRRRMADGGPGRGGAARLRQRVQALRRRLSPAQCRQLVLELIRLRPAPRPALRT